MKKIKSLLCLLMVAILLCPFLFSCGNSNHSQNETESTTKEEETTENLAEKLEREMKISVSDTLGSRLNQYCDTAINNIIDNYWDESKEYFVDPFKGRDTTSDCIWPYLMVMECFYTYCGSTKNQTVLDYIDAQMQAEYRLFSDKELTTAGNGRAPCCDDAGWAAMAFIIHYRVTGSERSLDNARAMITDSFDYFEDGDTSNGLWYSYWGPQRWDKQSFFIAFILSEFEYYTVTKGTEKEDAELHERALNLYWWIERNLYRGGTKVFDGITYNYNDGLYYPALIDNPVTGSTAPWSVLDQNRDGIFGLQTHVGMAVLHKRMYDLTGEQKYLDKAVSVTNAFVKNDKIVFDDVFNNYGDAWTNCAWIGYFVREVMPLDGIDDYVGRVFLNTAEAILHNCIFEGGYYGSDWTGGTRWINNGAYFGNPYVITNTATTVHMLCAIRYMLKNYYINVTEEDLANFFVATYPIYDAPAFVDLQNRRTIESKAYGE